MPKISALFSINITSPCLLEWPDGSFPELSLDFEDMQVKVRLWSSKDPRSKRPGSSNLIIYLNTIELVVTRNVDDQIPDVIISPSGRRDWLNRASFFGSLLPIYREAAFTIANRILNYFRFELQTPLVRPVSINEYSLQKPVWVDENMEEISIGNIYLTGSVLPIPSGVLNGRTFTEDEMSSFKKKISTHVEPNIIMELLSDAQTSWVEGNLRHSILELAICTEIMVKRKFFEKESPAGAAFDYLEDKAKVNVKVLELLDAVAKEAFSGSFKIEQPKNYANIDYLIRCRNKIAHRGELTYRDEFGKVINVDTKIVEGWWNSVVSLKEWLEML